MPDAPRRGVLDRLRGTQAPAITVIVLGALALSTTLLMQAQRVSRHELQTWRSAAIGLSYAESQNLAHRIEDSLATAASLSEVAPLWLERALLTPAPEPAAPATTADATTATAELLPTFGALDLNILAPDGTVLASSIPDQVGTRPPQPPGFDDVARGARHDEPVVGDLVIEPRSGRQVVPVWKTLRRADGRVTGVSAVLIDPFTWAPEQDSVAPMASARSAPLRRGALEFSVVTADGRYLLRAHGRELRFGEQITPQRLRRALAECREAQTCADPVDGVERFTSWLPVSGQPLMAAVGIAPADALAGHAPWQQQRRTLLLSAIGGVLLIAAFAIAHLLAQQRAGRRLRAAHQLWLGASNASLDAFMILRAVRDPATRAIVAFRCEAANRRVRDVFGIDAGTLMKTELRPPLAIAPRRGQFERLVDVVETGRPVDEEIEVTAAQVQASWVRQTVVRTGDGVAITTQDISHVKKIEFDLMRQIRVDELTGLPNRLQLIERFRQTLQSCHAQHEDAWMFTIDLDGFAAVSATHGLIVSDRVLQHVAQRLRATAGPADLVARPSPDGFVVLGLSGQGPQQARQMQRMLAAAVDGPLRVDGIVIDVRARIGAGSLRALLDAVADGADGAGAAGGPGAPTDESLLQQMDAAMRRARQAGTASRTEAASNATA